MYRSIDCVREKKEAGSKGQRAKSEFEPADIDIDLSIYTDG